MLTLANNVVNEHVAATGVKFEENLLTISLSDGREISLPLDRIEWLSCWQKPHRNSEQTGHLSQADMHFTGKI